MNIRDSTKLNGTIIELQTLILQAQEAALSAQKRETEFETKISDFEKEIARHKEWSIQSDKYELEEVSKGAFVYVKKTDPNNSTLSYWLCANCFNNEHKKSVMQFQKYGVDYFDKYECPLCCASIHVFNQDRKAISDRKIAASNSLHKNYVPL